MRVRGDADDTESTIEFKRAWGCTQQHRVPSIHKKKERGRGEGRGREENQCKI